MARFSNDAKRKILDMLILSASNNDGQPDYSQIIADLIGRSERAPSIWTLRKWFDVHSTAAGTKRDHRLRKPTPPTDPAGDVLAFPGVAPPSPRLPVFNGPDLTSMDRATFHRHMMSRLYETLDLAASTPLTLSSVKGISQQLEHHYESSKHAGADTPEAIDEAAFLERLDMDWSDAPDQYFERIMLTYARRHSVRLLAIRRDADDTRELSADGWRVGPTISKTATA